jgi:hypothetical protein
MGEPNEHEWGSDTPEPGAPKQQLNSPAYHELELQRDLAHLMIVEPFFAHVFQGMGRQITNRIDTAAVCWTGEMYLILGKRHAKRQWRDVVGMRDSALHDTARSEATDPEDRLEGAHSNTARTEGSIIG